ncbi:uncharacterized protein GLRG_09081 [Colletotrichum graminicola M1.001]|uniref:Secreted protein n=1 Tax=Colletotrichum graminicola (strain M1.001 / M2 / FGSC 10212) TaxID=645133 RepID=E3QSU9_COLGM|nr:uncharacterized protein GLRG_09081 [Colletotrichum graminicola M1.001]EFQ33937.1 hypothetical protein GLRG_09081 [Colletotrichum graminicola M1.001]
MAAAWLWLWLGRGCCWPVPTQYPSVCQCRRVAQVSVFSGLFGKGGRAERPVDAGPLKVESGRKSRSDPNGIGEQVGLKMPVGSAHEHVEKAGNASE